ncbi:MAG: hypothetical protein EOO41_04385, partial [Methanobacteriota archaeon]
MRVRASLCLALSPPLAVHAQDAVRRGGRVRTSPSASAAASAGALSPQAGGVMRTPPLSIAVAAAASRWRSHSATSHSRSPSPSPPPPLPPHSSLPTPSYAADVQEGHENRAPSPVAVAMEVLRAAGVSPPGSAKPRSGRASPSPTTHVAQLPTDGTESMLSPTARPARGVGGGGPLAATPADDTPTRSLTHAPPPLP